MKSKLWLIFFILLFANSVYIRFWPAAVFILAIIGLQLYVNLFPKSRWLKYLSYSLGPVPRLDEKESQYLFRLSLFAFSTFLISITIILTVSYISSNGYYELKTSALILGILFVFSILAGMGLLGSFICLLKGLWLRLRGNDRYFMERDEQAPT
jgi:hypothetical protein